MKEKILIITHSEDHECIPRVTEALEAQGAEVLRFDTDRYPTELGLTTDYSNYVLHNYLQIGDVRHNLSEITACWYRRLKIGHGIPQDLDPQLRRPSVEESRRSFFGILHSLDAFCLDPYFHVRRASVKQLQLKVAVELGLSIPKTCITNRPTEVRHFFQQCPGGVVAKMQTAFAVYQEGVENVVFTNQIGEEMLDELDGLELCPITFQEAIPKALELRVTIVGDQVYSAAIDSQRSERTRLDWRKDGVGLLDQWVDHPLPQELKDKLLAMMDRFELNYGAIDLILHPDGRYFFLEINPAGEFMWLEKTPGYPISEQLAKVLLGRAYRRNE
ncbi:MAG: MvdC/MvdD family ATP grasp protein [Bacteroidota bacterium]